MMLTFVIVAGTLAALVSAMLVLPLVKRREDGRGAATIAAIAVLFGVLFGGAVLYVGFSNYAWNTTAPVADTPASMTNRLAKRLAEHPDDLPGWKMLGRSYQELGQLPLAIRAYQRADRLANNQDADAVIGIAESLLMQDQQSIDGVAGKYFERALEIAPDNGKAMFFSAFAAMRRGELPLARERFARMLTLNPPAEVRPAIENQLARLDAALGAAGAAANDAPVAANEAARIRVRITLAPALAAKLAPGAPLFVLARDPKQPGPPFAVKQLAAQFPLEVELTPADAMMPARRISVGQQLEVVARVALGGTALATSGDPFGQVSYHVGKDARLEIVVDRLTP